MPGLIQRDTPLVIVLSKFNLKLMESEVIGYDINGDFIDCVIVMVNIPYTRSS